MDPSKQLNLTETEDRDRKGNVKILGVSHVSPESLEKIDEDFENKPDIIALELDPARLKALLQKDESKQKGPLWFRLVGKFQKYIGSKTGVMPGDEQIYAYTKAKEADKKIILIDQDVRKTIVNLKSVSTKEKIKTLGAGILSIFSLHKFDLSEIPSEEEVLELLDTFERHLPEFYKVLIHDRNVYMAETLANIHKKNPEKDILAVVGAAHKPGIEKILRDKNLIDD